MSAINYEEYRIVDRLGNQEAVFYQEICVVESIKTHEKILAKVSKIPIDDLPTKERIAKEIQLLFEVVCGNPAILKFLGFNLTDFKNLNFPIIFVPYLRNGSLRSLLDNEYQQQTNLNHKSDITFTNNLNHYNNNFTNNLIILNNAQKQICIFGIALAMKEMHKKGIVHRNIEPAFIMFDNLLNPLISDFGISKILLGEEAYHATPLYVSPEIYTGNEFNGKEVDVYSFSIIIFELLTRQSPQTSLVDGLMLPDVANSMLFRNEKQKQFVMKCSSSNPKERPTFETILNELLKDINIWIDDSYEVVNEVNYYLQNNFKISIDTSILKEHELQKVNNDDFLLKIDVIPNYYQLSKENKHLIHCAVSRKSGGDLESILRVARYLKNGENGFPKFPSEAANYYKIAIERGSDEAIYTYACMLHDGDYIPQDLAEAVILFKKSADLGNPDAMHQYANCLLDGEGIEKDQIEAAKYFKMSADAGNCRSMLYYACILFNGNMLSDSQENSQQNLKDAAKYYKMSADLGDSQAMYNYSCMLYKGNGVDQNWTEAAKYCKMSADLGEIEAIYNYANMLYKGEGVEPNKPEAAKFFKMSADAGEVEAMHKYAFMLYKGDPECVPKNLTESAKYFKMCADSGDPDAMYRYALMLNNGEGVTQNFSEAAKYYKMSAKKGNTEAMNNYGFLLYNGEGVEQSNTEAAKYCKMSADAGNTEAMNNYGCLLYNGEGVLQNLEEAAKYFKMGADCGNSDSMYAYGWMLEKGMGVTLNLIEAAKYYKMSADAGNEKGSQQLNYLQFSTGGKCSIQ